MGYGIEMLVAILLFLTGARNDLLDLIPTDAYWQAKKITVTLDQLQHDAGPNDTIAGIEPLLKDLASPEFKTRTNAKAALEALGPSVLPQLSPALASPNAEVKAIAAALTAEFEAKGKERAVRRLMAIRSLGERREQSARPLLKSLAEPKAANELFVADYAARALASLDNKPFTPPDRSPFIRQDLQLLPPHIGFAAQTIGLASQPPTLDSILDHIDLPNQNPQQPNQALTKAESLQRATAGLLQIAERIGNVRLDGLTAALSDDAGDSTGWEIILLRGKYDHIALRNAAKALAHPLDGPVKSFQIAGIDIVQTDVDTSIMFPSDDLAIIVMADEDKDRTPRMTALAAALKNPPADLRSNPDLAALLKTVDTTAPLWITGKLNPEEQKTKPLEGFDTVSLSSKRRKNTLAVTINAHGPDPLKIKTSTDELTTGIQWAKTILPPSRSFTPIIDTLTSIHITAAAQSATVTGQLTDDLAGAILSNVAPLILMNPPPTPDNPQAPQPIPLPK